MSDRVEEARKSTAENMGWPVDELMWIDDAYLDQPATDVEDEMPAGALDKSAEALPDEFYGHNTSTYRGNDGKFYYKFQSGQTACDLQWFTAKMERFNHWNQNNYCNGNVRPDMQVVRFKRK